MTTRPDAPPPLAALLLDAFAAGRDPRVEDPARTLRAAELSAHAGTVAERLRAAGIRPDEPVIVRVESSAADLASFLGVWLAGGVVVPLHARALDATARDIRGRTGARLTVDGTTGELAAGGDPPPARPLLRGAALVIFTSGSTGAPKGAVLGHERFAGKIRALQAMLGFSENSVVLLPLQITFIFGIWVGLLALASGARLRMMPRFTPALARAALADGATTAAFVPTMMRALFADAGGAGEAPALRQILTGGEPLGGGLGQRIAAAWPRAGVFDLYGLTETGSCDFCLSPGDSAAGQGTIGRPTGGVEHRIAIAEGGAGADGGNGGVGELLIRSPFGMLGYLDDPELTAASFADGYFRTGDLARQRPDGLVELAGRSKELISRGGNKVAPLEIDRLFAAHPDVAAALATGVPDPLLGERIHVLLVPRPGARLDRDALLAWAAGRIERFKLPDALHIGEDLPLGRTGKADRNALRRSILEDGA
ncbi:acyl-CoA synthetase (AMP-forming)/AMP-acid ligase II [Azospirillum agricola]|uniref:class I adenylate-forming enzyme family protein n=1 Tax=Azospirillum agricola TaxID=1720247 RepID=UPI001AE5B13B|nr:long-chain fatty acid--CoA ligase [Azospirillum agricola]MBP2230981.1 acyl-CoA synthetase (AMP-forming)/AMP-acid ligase II [Azospirillum agricola]